MKQFSDDSRGQAGLTLLESLVAIAVIGVTVAVAAPVVLISVATRVQNQRAEQAWRLAQSEIDNIRLLVEQGGDYSTEIGIYPISGATPVQSTGAPTAFNPALDSTRTDVAKAVSVDGDPEPEFAVQVFRTPGLLDGTPSVPIAFEVGVRVYDHDAAQSNLGSLLTDEAPLGLIGPGVSGGSNTGQRRRQPLAEVYTEILQGEREGAFCKYWEYLSSTASTTGLNCS